MPKPADLLAPPPAPFEPADNLAAAALIDYCGDDEYGVQAAVLLATVAMLRRLDAFAEVLAGVAGDMKAATGGGLLGLLTGGRK